MQKAKSMFDSTKAVIFDSLQNLLTGLGVEGVDKSVSSSFYEVEIDPVELEAAYSSDWLSAKVCNLPPFDMTRAWRKMDGKMSPEKLGIWKEFEKEIKLQEKTKEAMTWGRLYGGAGIIINVDDGHKHEPWEPLEIERIKKDSLKFLIVSDKQFLHVGRIDNDPLSENFGYPETYRMAPSSIEIHHSRVCRFEGLKLPLNARRKNRYWGKSIIESIHSALLRAGEVQESVGTLIHEATVDVIKIPDLMSLISSSDTEAQLKKRFGVAKLQKSVNRMLLLDADEEYEQTNQSFTGLTDMIEKFLSIVGGAADIPITRLLGSSPAGMNSTGESDIRNYYDMLSSKQETEFRPKLEYLDKIIYRSLFGSEPPAGELDFSFNPLWQMSEQEKAELETSRASRDDSYLASNIINEAIIAKDLMERGVYSGVDSEYVKEMEEIVKEADNEGEPGEPVDKNKQEEENANKE